MTSSPEIDSKVIYIYILITKLVVGCRIVRKKKMRTATWPSGGFCYRPWGRLVAVIVLLFRHPFSRSFNQHKALEELMSLGAQQVQFNVLDITTIHVSKSTDLRNRNSNQHFSEGALWNYQSSHTSPHTHVYVYKQRKLWSMVTSQLSGFLSMQEYITIIFRRRLQAANPSTRIAWMQQHMLSLVDHVDIINKSSYVFLIDVIQWQRHVVTTTFHVSDYLGWSTQGAPLLPLQSADQGYSSPQWAMILDHWYYLTQIKEAPCWACGLEPLFLVTSSPSA